MAFKCAVIGKKPSKGNRLKYRGIAIKKGGIGLKITGKTRRTFKPNLQKIRVKLPNGQVKRMLVSVKAIKKGLIQKA